MPGTCQTRRPTAQLGSELPCLSMSFPQSAIGKQPNHHNCADNQENKHQCAGPGLAMPFIEGRNCIVENLQRQSCRRLIEFEIPELVPECGKQERSSLTRNPGKGEHDAGDNSGSRGAQHYGHGSPPVW